MERKPDYILLIIFIILTILGILILSSVSATISQEKFETSFYYLNHQVLFGLIPGLILGFLAFKMNLNLLKKFSPLILLINLILMVMVFLPEIGLTIRGGARWISLGPISFQPSEFLKLSFIIYLATWLASRAKESLSKKNFSQTLIAFLILIGIISLVLVFQPDVSTLGIILISALAMFFLAKTPIWHSLLIVLTSALFLLPLIKIAPYRFTRILVFLNPELDPMGIGYQIKQALIAIGSGGIWGSGLGLSKQKFGFLPQSISDSIFAIFAEETGFFGSLILILLYLIFFWRGFRIGKEKEGFLKLVAFGITFWITLQAFVNIGSMIGILPLTGIPLPFISYGGSHLITELAGVGILLNISKNKT